MREWRARTSPRSDWPAWRLRWNPPNHVFIPILYITVFVENEVGPRGLLAKPHFMAPLRLMMLWREDLYDMQEMSSTSVISSACL